MVSNLQCLKWARENKNQNKDNFQNLGGIIYLPHWRLCVEQAKKIILAKLMQVSKDERKAAIFYWFSGFCQESSDFVYQLLTALTT